MKVNRIVLGLAALVVILLLWEWVSPYSVPKKDRDSPPELPALEHNVNPEALANVLQNNLWDKDRGKLQGDVVQRTDGGGEGSAGQQGSQPVSWQLLGVSSQGKDSLVVVKIDDEIKSYRQGEQMPGGLEIVKIMPYGVRVANKDKDEYVYLFGKQ